MKNRKAGYYWVKRGKEWWDDGFEWTVAQWSPFEDEHKTGKLSIYGIWKICGTDELWDDFELSEINDQRLISPGEITKEIIESKP